MRNSDQSPRDYLHPTRECDLVMKGGATSGVVYPPAVLGLAPDYRFRSIGGTSAGAIAAATTAAAEYGRECGGFDHLEQVSRELAEPNMILNLFQPSAKTRPLMDTLFTLAESWEQAPNSRGPRLARDLTRALWKNTPRFCIAGGAVGVGGSMLLTFITGGSVNIGSLAVAVVAGWLGGVAAGMYKLSNVLFGDLPNQSYFGICTGLQSAESSDAPVLTNWLSATINRLAGLDVHGPPLTFAQLVTKKQTMGQPNIELRMIAANLNQSRPYVLPFKTRTFLFKEAEMRDFFPGSVVDAMVQYSHEHACAHFSLDDLPGYHWLPVGDALPVIVATRMSLSFPLLISAIPLYTIKRSALTCAHVDKLALTEDDLQCNWFSDGGICSNFPIHFFDSWFPTRPTFGINLVSAPEQAFRERAVWEEPDQKTQVFLADYQSITDADHPQIGGYDLYGESHAEVRPVYLPRADDPVFPVWQEMNGMLPFIKSLFATAQNYRDTLQSQLLSYRDRIVQVRFEPHEGGLNLAMQAETITNIQQKGATASAKIHHYFKFDHHQWNRLLVLLALMERQFKDLQETIDEIGWENLEALFERQRQQMEPTEEQTHFPFQRDDERWIAETKRRIQALYDLIYQMKDLALLEETPPPPEPVLRITPEI
ncbi:MAG: patatin-like phospholipase family protein [Chloroflexales bacterium]|nr:patatin-like phospholipase family protein [Chloroflexales bacterium]